MVFRFGKQFLSHRIKKYMINSSIKCKKDFNRPAMLFYFCCVTLISSVAKAQTISLLTSGTKTSLRGLSVVSDKIIWASGSNGMIARSADGGNTFKWLTVKGFETTDFRDIEAFDSSAAIIMAVAEPAYILKTVDGGNTWKVVYTNKVKGMFLDAMDFENNKNGVVIGDPINNKFFIACTFNGGNSWQQNKKVPGGDSAEACFASSGTNIKLLKQTHYVISGGLRSRLFINCKSVDLPILQGKETTGANSIAIKNTNTFIVVGGDFNAPDSIQKNCVITFNKGKTWAEPDIAPHGYRSCVEYINHKIWITCGLNGVDYSNDDGKIWKWISKESFHVCKKTKNGDAVFFAGSGGRIGKINLQSID